MDGKLMRKIIAAALMLCVTALPLQAGMLAPIVFSNPAAAGGCSPTLDATSQTGKLAVGLRKLKNSYAGNLINISVTGTTGTYFDVGLSGCNLDLSLLSSCSSTTAPTTTTGCPVKTLYDQSGNGCNPTQAVGIDQPWFALAQTPNGHPALFFNGVGSRYVCTLPGAIGGATYAGVFNVTATTPSAGMADIGNGTTFDTYLLWSSSQFVEFVSYDQSTVSNSNGSNSSGSYVSYIGSAPSTGGALLITNASNAGTGASITPTTGTKFVLGADQGEGLVYTGKFSELVITTPVPGCTGASGDCRAMYNAQHGYW